jgi:hypothetical protein
MQARCNAFCSVQGLEVVGVSDQCFGALDNRTRQASNAILKGGKVDRGVRDALRQLLVFLGLGICRVVLGCYGKALRYRVRDSGERYTVAASPGVAFRPSTDGASGATNDCGDLGSTKAGLVEPACCFAWGAWSWLLEDDLGCLGRFWRDVGAVWRRTWRWLGSVWAHAGTVTRRRVAGKRSNFSFVSNN